MQIRYLYGSVIYVAAYQGQLVALSSRTGQVLWQRDLSTYNNFALQGNLIVVADEQGVVWAINRLMGNYFGSKKPIKPWINSALDCLSIHLGR